MNDLLNQLLGLESLRFGDEHARLGWAHVIPAWAWLLIVAAAVTVAVWSYTAIAAPARARVALAAVRALLLVLIAVLAAGPRLERERTEIEPDRLVVLLDRSASLGIPDTPGGTRDEQLRAALEQHAETFAELAETKHLVWLGFENAVVDLGPPDPLPESIPPAVGERTAVGAAIEEAVRRSAAHPLSGIVLFSDGRSADRIPPETLRALKADRVPVHTVPLGSTDRMPDLAVLSATAPAVAYVEDTIPVTVRYSSEGVEPTNPGAFEFVDESTGLVFERRRLTPQELAEGEVTISTRTETPGPQRWTIRYIPEGPDLTPQNNSTSLAVRFVDQPIRVLYVDGSPRWEHRYLKSLLIREDSVDASCLLLAVNRRYQQEGNTLLTTLPQRAEQWAPFDVIIIGDLNPELLGRQALADIRKQVGDEGAGLLWLAGPTATPHAWTDTPLADLLPLIPTDAGAARAVPVWNQPIVFQPSPLARRLGLFDTLTSSGSVGGVDDLDAGWSALRWAIRIEPSTLKAATETLALARPIDGDAPRPLVVSMRYGSGRSTLVATDEIWRWRYGRGEGPTERFWLPLIRSLARPRLAALGQPATLEVTPPMTPAGRIVTVELTVTDQALADIAPSDLSAQVVRTPATGAAPRPIRLIRDPAGAAGRARFTASFTALEPGSFAVRVGPDALGGIALESPLDVIAPDDEMRNPRTDHDHLAEIARETGGRVIPAPDLDSLPSLLPNRRIIIPQPPETSTLWDTPAALILVLTLLTMEWVGRRMARLT